MEFKKRYIFHIIEWILAVIAAGLAADIWCLDCLTDGSFMKNEFVVAVLWSFMILTSLFIIIIFFSEEAPPPMDYIKCVLGALLYIAAAILIYLSISSWKRKDGGSFAAPTQKDFDTAYYRYLVAAIFALINAIVLIIEFVISMVNSSILD